MKFYFSFLVLAICLASLVTDSQCRKANLKSTRRAMSVSEMEKVLSHAESTIKNTRRKTSLGKVLIQYSKDVKDLMALMTTEFIKDENTEVKTYGVIYKNDKAFHLANDNSKLDKKSIVAEINFHKTLNEIGWDKLSVSTYSTVNPYLQSFFAGYLEGRATANDMFDFYDNMKQNKVLESKSKKKGAKNEFEMMEDFFRQVDDNLSRNMESYMTNKNKEIRKNWSRLILGYSQLWGLMAGYTKQIKLQKEYEKKKLRIEDLLILQADGEVPELLRYFSYLKRQEKTKIGDKDYFKKAFEIDAQSPDEFWEKFKWHSKCSAFIKLVKDKSGSYTDILASHNTWTDYYEMLRTYKHYKFEFEDNEVVKANELTFSSYPGALSSTDDFYLNTQNVLVMETTIDVVDVSEFKHVKPADKYIPNFMRVLAATRFAQSGREWLEIFKSYNSGTYSSQWMIIDYNIFKKIKGTKEQPKELLYVVEQNPKHLIYHDISEYLFSNGFFSSFNRAFLPQSKVDLHIKLIKHVYGDRFGYSGSERGKIFRHYADKVVDLKSMKDIMRYNGYKNKQESFPDDPSYSNAGDGISARYDLSTFFNLSGGVDCKVTNFELSKTLTALAVSGPTTDNNENLKPFEFKSEDKTIRQGVPKHFDYSWIVTNPKTLKSKDPFYYNWDKKEQKIA